MILVVDDDQAALAQLGATLRDAGHRVVTCSGAAEALHAAAGEDPDVIISDLMMPEMDGFAFRRAYASKFPGRATPFIYLSSRSDDASMVQGLDLGAEDFLVKPVSAPVLLAKVRAAIRRRADAFAYVFQGDLASIPFCSVMRFCELKGLTGTVQVEAPGFQARVRFRSGELQAEGNDEVLTRICDLREGSFRIRSEPARFDDVDGIAPVAAPTALLAARPIGRLSTVEVGKGRLQVQTEALGDRDRSLVTLVTVDGRPLYKRVSQLQASADPSSEQDQLDRQHHEVEREMAARVDAARERLSAHAEDPHTRFHRLFDDGYEHYRAGRWSEALAAWTQAQQLAPGNATVRVNIEVVKAKMAGA